MSLGLNDLTPSQYNVSIHGNPTYMPLRGWVPAINNNIWGISPLGAYVYEEIQPNKLFPQAVYVDVDIVLFFFWWQQNLFWKWYDRYLIIDVSYVKVDIWR